MKRKYININGVLDEKLNTSSVIGIKSKLEQKKIKYCSN